MLHGFNMTAGHAVYAVAWGPESDQVVFSSGSNLFIKPIQVLPSSLPRIRLSHLCGVIVMAYGWALTACLQQSPAMLHMALVSRLVHKTIGFITRLLI